MSSFSYEAEIAAPPSVVRRLLTDETFLTAWSRRQHPLEADVTGGADRASVRWVFDATTIPSGFRPMVGEQVTVPIGTEWDPEHDGVHAGRLRTHVRARKSAEADATMVLRPSAGGGTTMTVRGVLKAHGGGIATGVIEGAITRLVVTPLFAGLHALLDEHVREPAGLA